MELLVLREIHGNIKGKINWFLMIMYREKGSMESVEISESPVATQYGVGG